MILLLTLIVLSGITSSETNLLIELRRNYEASSKSEKVCDKMLKSIPAHCSNTEMGYKGALFMMKASYAWMPTEKLHYFNQGKDVLEQAIKKEPENAELRFIRYSLQQSIPTFLGYDHKRTDREFLQKELPLIKDAELKKLIHSYLKIH